MPDNLWSQPHHDGSQLYVPEPRLGGKVIAFLRVLSDGEPELVRAVIDRQNSRDTWLRVADDSLTFLRKAPGETVLVHAARADHAPVRIPAAVVGPELRGSPEARICA